MVKTLVNQSGDFKIVSPYKPAGDQIGAIQELIQGLNQNKKDQVLLGVTGSGKTFTMANVIERTQRPAIIMVPNKTLAAQIYSEMKGFFPNNAVEYFVSYYDYYQPEAYIAKTNTYIEKDSAINEQINLMRHSATISLMSRRDAIIVTSVSSIYGLGSPSVYQQMVMKLQVDMEISRNWLLNELIAMQYQRNEIDFIGGTFRVRGDVVDVFPIYSEDVALRIEFFGDKIEFMCEIDPLINKKLNPITSIDLFPSAHYATPRSVIKEAVKHISQDLDTCLQDMIAKHKITEAQRLEERTRYDMEMMLEVGSCKGIENYSRYVDGRQPNEPPYTLFHYLSKDAILFVDESHVALPQIRAMYAGDRSRKVNLVEHGFRLPSAFDNRPLTFEEWDGFRPQTIYVSATPGNWEIEKSKGVVVSQVIRPTGLLDPECEIRPISNQVDDITNEVSRIINENKRVIVITLTKKMAENLNDYFGDIGIKSRYIHSDTDTVERVQILKMLRDGTIDVVVGINLLREGIDIPECGLVAIMDADKEGFLRSESSLIQIIGRAARNSTGKVILYADTITKSIKSAMETTASRRKIQHEYNQSHGITPQTIKKVIDNSFDRREDLTLIRVPNSDSSSIAIDPISAEKKMRVIKKEMLLAAKNLDFERAAKLRDELRKLTDSRLKM